MFNFLLVPLIVLAALTLDGVIITMHSYQFGTWATLLCPISGCDFKCDLSCAGVCDANVG